MRREDWLNSVKELLEKEVFGRLGYVIPPVRLSCGWPSARGLSKNNRRVGECWAAEASFDKVHEIFISPYLEDRVEVAATVMHELVHAIAGVQEKHGRAFKKVCTRIGLIGPVTNNLPSPGLREFLVKLVDRVGPYEHASIDAIMSDRKKQTTRMIKLECEYCGYTVRTTMKWLGYGLPRCVCEHDFKVADGGVKKEDEKAATP